MALITNNISGSSADSSRIGITGSVIISNTSVPFPSAVPDAVFYISGTKSVNTSQTDQDFNVSPSKAVFDGDVTISGSAKIVNDLFFTSGSIQIAPGPAERRIVMKGNPATSTTHAASMKFFGGDDTINSDPNVTAGNVIFQVGGASNGASPGEMQMQLGQGDGVTVNDGRGVFYVGDVGGHILINGFIADEGEPGAAVVGVDSIFYISGTIDKSGYEGRKTVLGGDARISGSLSQGEDTETVGHISHAEGYRTVASGSYSHAEGTGSIAYGNYSHAEGGGFDSTADEILQIMRPGGRAYGSGSHAEGVLTVAYGPGSHTEGFSSITDFLAPGSHAEGDRTIASGSWSHTEGRSTRTYGTYAHAEGIFSEAFGTGAHASGYYVIASGTNNGQNVVGMYNKRDNDFSLFVVGNGTNDANALRSDVFRVNPGSPGDGRVEVTGSLAATQGLSGSLTKLVDGTSYLIAGSNVTITSASNGAVTINATAGGGGSSIFTITSNGTYATTTSSVAFAAGGTYPNNVGTNVFFFVSGSISGSGNADKVATIGGDLYISGGLSQGNLNTNRGKYAHAQGNQNLIRGDQSGPSSFYGAYAHAEGGFNIVLGQYSHAEGFYTISSGNYSHSEGKSTVAAGVGSHAEGGGGGDLDYGQGNLDIPGNYNTTAYGNYSHAEGYGTLAFGGGSHAEGYFAIAKGDYSHAEGNSTIASGTYQTVVGQYNTRNNASSLFVIGNGTTDNNRSDVVRVESTVVQITGSLNVSGDVVGTDIGLVYALSNFNYLV